MLHPSIKRISAIAAGVLFATALWAACDAGKRYEPNASLAALERAKMCSAGGAVLNVAATGCVCPDPQLWDGTRCMTAAVEEPEPVSTAMPPVDDLPDALTAVEPEVAPVATPAVDPMMESYIRVCRRAPGLWQDGDQYCLCPKGGLVVGRRCRDVNGRLSDDLCERAPFPGRFVSGDCRCPDGQVFAPLLGGCVVNRPLQAVTKWRSCESTLNRGKWNVRADVCACPTGRVWDGHLCQPKNRLSSRSVCESAGNGGKWQASRKTCNCGPGRLWVDQACQKRRQLTAEAACKSELNAGRWHAERKTCICPRLTQWDGARAICR